MKSSSVVQRSGVSAQVFVFFFFCDLQRGYLQVWRGSGVADLLELRQPKEKILEMPKLELSCISVAFFCISVVCFFVFVFFFSRFSPLYRNDSVAIILNGPMTKCPLNMQKWKKSMNNNQKMKIRKQQSARGNFVDERKKSKLLTWGMVFLGSLIIITCIVFSMTRFCPGSDLVFNGVMCTTNWGVLMSIVLFCCILGVLLIVLYLFFLMRVYCTYLESMKVWLCFC